jgi:hypothetical protein
MDDALLVRRLEGLGDLSRDPERLVDGKGPACHERREILALDQLHDERARRREFFDAVDVRDVGVIQRRQRLGLAHEPRQPVRIAGEELGQDLDRDVAIEPRIAGRVDLAHAARAKRTANLVRTETRTGGERHLPVSIG